MREFYGWENKVARIRLAVMDMWKPFRNATEARAPQAAILYDKFHVMRHLGKALDKVEKRVRAAGGQRSTLHQGAEVHAAFALGEPDLQRPPSVQDLLPANKRLNTAYLLKESFGQLWSYEREGWARRFFENWRRLSNGSGSNLTRNLLGWLIAIGMALPLTANRRTKSRWDSSKE